MAAQKSKATLVLLHGLGGSPDDWAPAGKILAKAFAVKALALPEPDCGSDADPESLARALLGEIGKAPFFLAGHSLGGRVAGEIASLEPARVRALALVSPLGSAPYGLTDRLKWKAMSRRALLEALSDSSLASAAGYGFAMKGPGHAGFVARTLASQRGNGKKKTAQATERYVDGLLSARPLAEKLKSTSMPLLVVTGAEDPLAPADDVRKILPARKNAVFEELRGIGHYALLEDPPRLAETLRAFFLGA